MSKVRRRFQFGMSSLVLLMTVASLTSGSSVNPQVIGIVGLLVTEKQATAISEAVIGKLELAPPGDTELIE